VTQVTIHIKTQKDPTRAHAKAFVEQLVDRPLVERQHLSREEYAASFGAAPEDVQKIRKFAREFGLQVVPDQLVRKTRANHLGHRTAEIRGTNAALSRAFGVKLVRVREGKRVYRSHVGAISVPEAFQEVIQNVLGLDTRPPAKPRIKTFPRLGGFAPHLGSVSFNPDQIAKLYNFPTGVTGKGQTIALVELGGGFRPRDLKTYFQRLGIPKPVVKAVSVGKGRNHPTGNPNGDDAEVMLDIEVAGAVAPGATILVYFAPNTNRGFFRCVNGIVHDNLHKPTILSISWGGAESTWTATDMTSFDEAFQAAAAMGISVFSAAGDNGSTDGEKGNAAHVDFPASSPNNTSCGGTRLVSSGGNIAESVWNDGASGGGTGGGISEFFPVPQYQTGSSIHLPKSLNPGGAIGRGVPDVAGDADPVTGYNVRVDGIDSVIGGTSAVAPLWAGLTALINESLGRSAGFLNPFLYTVPSALHDVTNGNNDTTGQVGGYPAGPGWDACTGLGTPDGAAVLNAIRTAT
jgi:kumamolisin